MTDTDALTEARDTNMRLNRRVQELEGPLQSLIGKAQHEVQKAQAETAVAQRQVSHVNGLMARELTRRIDEMHAMMGLFAVAAVCFFWAAIVTGILIFRIV